MAFTIFLFSSILTSHCKTLAYILFFLCLLSSIRVTDIDGRWVTLEELANSVIEGGHVSNNIAELHIRTLSDSVPPGKIIFPWLPSVYLLICYFTSKFLIEHFRRDVNYILSHQIRYIFYVNFILFCF